MTLVVLRGTSCAGKSSLSANYRPAVVISSDQIREEMLGTAQVPPESSVMIWGEVHRRLAMRMRAKLFTIFDATNLSMKSIRKVYDIADAHGVETHVISLQVPFETCKERMEFRRAGVVSGAVVPLEALSRQHEQYESKKKSVKNFFKDNFFEGNFSACEGRIDWILANQNVFKFDHDKVFVFGDAHGNLTNLKKLAAKIPSDAVYFGVGDMIDRGEDSFGVLEFLSNDKRFMGFAMGNHESAFLHERSGAPCRSAARRQTHAEFEELSECDQAKYIQFMYSGRSYIVVENHNNEQALITHAGLGSFDPQMVSVFVASSHRMNPVGEYPDHAPVQVHGHMSWEYSGDFTGNVLNIESGDGYGKLLTAINPFTKEIVTSE